MLTVLKELLNVETIKKNTGAVFIAFLMLIAGYSLNGLMNRDEAADARVDKIQREKDSIAGKYFDLLIKLYERDKIIERQKEAITKTDSLIRVETKKDAEQIIKQVN